MQTHRHATHDRRGPHPVLGLLGLVLLVKVVAHKRGHDHRCTDTADAVDL